MNVFSIVSLCIAGISLILSVYFSSKSIQRSEINDSNKQTTEFTTMLVELKYISKGVSDIKDDVALIKIEQQNIRDRVVKGEESIKQAHKRIDSLTKV